MLAERQEWYTLRTMAAETNDGRTRLGHYPRRPVRPSPNPRRSTGALLLALSFLLFIPTAQATTGEGEAWPVFNESNGCDRVPLDNSFAWECGGHDDMIPQFAAESNTNTRSVGQA